LPRDRCRLFWGGCLHDWAKICKHRETGNFASPTTNSETIKKLDSDY
jgi:hypothetical protein